ncbi:hypothetical protein ACFLTW_05270 [Chloroflexota bacterium]
MAKHRHTIQPLEDYSELVESSVSRTWSLGCKYLPPKNIPSGTIVINIMMRREFMPVISILSTTLENTIHKVTKAADNPKDSTALSKWVICLKITSVQVKPERKKTSTRTSAVCNNTKILSINSITELI